jgi:hypothetical protein
VRTGDETFACPGQDQPGANGKDVDGMGVITREDEEEEVIIFIGNPEDAPVREPSPELVPERETVPA